MKIISVVGARPNFMKIAAFADAIEAHNSQGKAPYIYHKIIVVLQKIPCWYNIYTHYLHLFFIQFFIKSILFHYNNTFYYHFYHNI